VNTPARILQLCRNALQVDLVRASGPGGQNVNKTATAVQLRFHARNCRHLSVEARKRLVQAAGARANSEGTIIIRASRHRTQQQNRQDALNRLLKLLEKSASAPARRIPTKQTAASRERRLRAKKIRSGVKRLRSGESA
jgi:ribosome-associated protein